METAKAMAELWSLGPAAHSEQKQNPGCALSRDTGRVCDRSPPFQLRDAVEHEVPLVEQPHSVPCPENKLHLPQ